VPATKGVSPVHPRPAYQLLAWGWLPLLASDSQQELASLEQAFAPPEPWWGLPVAVRKQQEEMQSPAHSARVLLRV